MNKPHKHAELIKAWADGAQIEWYCKISKIWREVNPPQWSESNEYRIKPEEKKPIVRWKWAELWNTDWFESEYFYTEEEFKRQRGRSTYLKLEYTRTEFPE